MTTAVLNFIWWFFSLSWLTGPIFDKELRVSSRRRRNYVLRFAYLALLTVFLVLFWLRAVPSGGSGLYQTSRMAEAGKVIITFIVWFQFIATQIVAGIMLSTSISDEIYNRTLGLLMTTPINSFQIVTGKLFSKLLQLILLLAISLPLLAIVRVFGGVPWDYILSSLCITLTTIIFVGSLSLFFSIFSRRAYVVIILTILTLGVLFALLPFLAGMLCNAITGHWPQQALTTAIFYPNPYGAMMFNTMMMAQPRAMGAGFMFYWPLHCGVMMGASAFVLFLSVCMVRRVALRQATGQLGVSACRLRSDEPAGTISPDQPVFIPAPKRVKGPPVLWKELRRPMFGRRKIAFIISIAIGLIILFSTYALCANEQALDDEGTHIIYTVIFLALGTLFTIILPATCITSEKESRSWPLLLATTLSNWQILLGKLAGIFRRCLPIWCVLFGHIILFTLAGIIHPVAFFQIAILVAWVVVFLSGTGLYFSSRFKRTTTAVIMNFALAATIWALLPLLMILVVEITHDGYDLAEAYIDTNPFVHAVIIMDAAVDWRGGLGSYYWPGLNSQDVFGSTIWMLFCMLGYMFAGLIFAWRAKCRFRRNIF